MWRRIYCSFPAARQARRVVAELETAGISREHIHALARSDIDISGLPVANEAQRTDRALSLETAFWYGNLMFFALALIGVGLALYAGSILFAVIAAVLAAISVGLGKGFAAKVPHAHLSEMRVPLAHGEVVLMVDVPSDRVHEVEQLVSRRHPEAAIGGVGWTIASADL